MRVRRAEPGDLEVVLAVLAGAARWLKERGIEQWPDRMPVEWVKPAIERGETWLAGHGGEVVGTLVVQWDDPIFWAGYPTDAGYLHRLAVRRHGDRLGSQLLEWAERHAAGNGKAYLRLDCVSWNQPLCAYYERAGYAHLSDVTVGEYTQARYEKRVR
jgi:GNAT superfamily N-acetyltransferase